VSFKSAIAQSLQAKVWPLCEQGAFKPVIYKTFPAAEASKAHELMESNQHIGKIVLIWDGAK
jgi:NADPH2:quinone reductase